MKKINLAYGELDIQALSALLKRIECIHTLRNFNSTSPDVIISIVDDIQGNWGLDCDGITYEVMAEYVMDHQDKYIPLINEHIQKSFI